MRAISLVGILLLSSYAPNCNAAENTPPAQIGNGLVLTPNSRARLAYIHPDANWSKYRTIELGALQIPLSVREGAGKGKNTRFRESYVLRDEDVAALQEDYAKAAREQLTQAGYTVVTTRGPDTLIVAAQIVDLRLNAPIESTRQSYAGSGRVYSSGGGSMTVGAVLADGATGQVLAQFADSYAPSDIWGINNSVTNRSNARQGFKKWARKLGEGLAAKRGAIRQGLKLRSHRPKQRSIRGRSRAPANLTAVWKISRRAGIPVACMIRKRAAIASSPVPLPEYSPPDT